MNKHHLSLTQGSFILALIITGSSFIVGVNDRAGQDAWASMIIGYVLMLFLSLIYVRLTKLTTNCTCFFDAIRNIVGNTLGNLIILLYAFYALHLGSMVTRNFTEFIEVVSMPETPQLPLMMIILATSVYLAASGIKTLGKWAVVTFPILIISVSITVLFSLNIFDRTFIYPILNTPPSVIFFGAFEILAFPLAETIIFLDLLFYIKKEVNSYKIYLYGVSFGALLLIIVIIRNIFVLGPNLIDISYFPSYSAAKAIQVGKILQRIEGTITINFVLGGIVKIAVCLLFASRAIAKLLNVNCQNSLIVSCGLIMLTLTANSVTNIIQMFSFINIYALYACPFQIIIPLLLWIIAEIKHLRSQKQSDAQVT